MADASPDIVVTDRLPPETVSDVRRVVDAATEADGVRPLSEHAMLQLRYGGDTGDRNVMARQDGTLAGYAHLDATDLVEGASAELVVDPAWRGRGIGRALVTELIRLGSGGGLRLWAHGDHPAAQLLAKRMGFERVRALWHMRRSLSSPLPELTLPAGVTLRTFRPGSDDGKWLALNAAAFADHPEQGRWTAEDLQQRMAELWFDPAGFLLAERDGRLVGFHWTKVHGGTADGHEPIGEVYVVGVAASERGNGLGRSLTIAGLQHLRSLGLAAAMLYVDEENDAAIRLYTKLGFTRWDTDVMYARS